MEKIRQNPAPQGGILQDLEYIILQGEELKKEQFEYDLFEMLSPTNNFTHNIFYSSACGVRTAGIKKEKQCLI